MQTLTYKNIWDNKETNSDQFKLYLLLVTEHKHFDCSNGVWMQKYQ